MLTVVGVDTLVVEGAGMPAVEGAEDILRFVEADKQKAVEEGKSLQLVVVAGMLKIKKELSIQQYTDCSQQYPTIILYRLQPIISNNKQTVANNIQQYTDCTQQYPTIYRLQSTISNNIQTAANNIQQ